ncbi:FAR1 DNA-binding domain [Sesbania bispinosa]|nr:FAR1 DNA-binding domain [Sesbania bispinosa]
MRTESNRKSDGVEPEKYKSTPKHNIDFDEIVDGYKKISELTDEDIRALEFDSEEDAYVFYREYAKFIGFAVRKHDVYRDRNDVITMRQFVCNKEGERSGKHLNRTDRKREAKAITRTRCNARLQIHLDYKSRKWIVGSFEPAHNHELILASMVHLLPAYRGLSVANKAHVDGLYHYGVRTFHIMGLIMGQKGGYSDLGFCKKDLYNHIDKVKRAKIEDGDAFAALCYLQEKTTSICEGINSFIKRVVNDYKHNELTSDFKSTYTQPMMTTALEKYELEASNVYTRNKFFDDRKEIEKVAAINVIDRSDVGNIVRMKMNKFGSPDVENVVQLDKSNGHTVRTCKKYATHDQLDTVLEEQSSVETDEESRNKSLSVNPHFSQDLNDVSISVDHNRASDKGQSKKKRKHNEGVKLTQESVNELRSSDVNTTYESGMRSKFILNLISMSIR